jgi:uncharacterized protein YaaW (UPF0174 family)
MGLVLLDLVLLDMGLLVMVSLALHMATTALLQEAGHGVLVAAVESVDLVLPVASVAAPIVH